jgi:spermidine synthase
MNSLGRHILVEFYGCSSEVLNDVPRIESSMVSAAKEAGATIISSTFFTTSRPLGFRGWW